MKNIEEQIHKLIRANRLSDADAIATLNSVRAVYQRRLDDPPPSINDIILSAAGAAPPK